MKNIYLLILLIGSSYWLIAQPATLEELPVGSSGIWNGVDGSGGFTSGNFRFLNDFNSDYQSWSGFAYTNHTNTLTRGYDNQYSAIAGSGAEGSAVYAVAYTMWGATIQLTEKQVVSGLYVTNSTYAYWSMTEGDDFSKKFGGPTGTDPDYFRLLITGYNAGGDSVGNIVFYLADFRFDKKKDDYIVKDWTWVDLRPLGEVSSIGFSLESTDMGSWGMNTPAYFCIDNVDLKSTATAVVPAVDHILTPKIWPNPVVERLNISLPEGSYSLQISNIQGQTLIMQEMSGNGIHDLELGASLPAGIYILTVTDEKQQRNAYRIIKR